MREKTFKGFLILNWKNGSMRIIKRFAKLSSWEMKVPINLKVQMAELSDSPITATIIAPTMDITEVKF